MQLQRLDRLGPLRVESRAYGYTSIGSVYNWATDIHIDKYSEGKRRKPVGVELLFNGTTLRHKTEMVNQNSITIQPYVPGQPDSYYKVPARNLFDSRYPGDEIGASLDNALASRLHQKVKNQKINVGMMLAEHRQTANLFADAAKRVAASWRRVRKGDIAGGFSAFGGRGQRRVSNNWLAFQYGVRPLVSDIVNSLELLDRQLIEPPKVFKTSANITGSWQTFSQAGGTNKFHSQTKKLRLTCYYTVDSSSLKTASSLGLTNPLSLAWELVPYSFVIDWFINIGDYLESLDTLSGINRVGVYQSHRIDAHGSQTNSLGANVNYTFKEVSRRSIGFPSIRVEFMPSLSWQRIVSAGALLRSSRSM